MQLDVSVAGSAQQHGTRRPRATMASTDRKAPEAKSQRAADVPQATTPAATSATPGATPPADMQGPEAKRDRQNPCPSSSSHETHTLRLRGLNMQWPFSQLLLQGCKTEEVRTGPLLGFQDEDLWLIETPSSDGDPQRNAVLDFGTIAPRPQKAQTVGVIRFSTSTQYANKQTFRAAEAKHRIRPGGRKDWLDDKPRYAWHVSKVVTLGTPAPPPPAKGQVSAAAYTLTVRFGTAPPTVTRVQLDNFREGFRAPARQF